MQRSGKMERGAGDCKGDFKGSDGKDDSGDKI